MSKRLQEAALDLQIEARSHFPVHVQLVEQIRFLIVTGELKPGARLPAARGLAAYLRINRNTVLRAYNQLARKGLILSRRGRGSSVVEGCQVLKGSSIVDLGHLIDDVIERAAELGVSPQDFAAMAYARARHRPEVKAKRRLVVVECETSIATALAQGLEREVGSRTRAVLLEDLRRPTPEARADVVEADLVATTFFHIQEVRRLVEPLGKKAVALVVKPHLEQLVRVAAIPPGTSVALVCVNQSRVEEMERSLEEAGIRQLAFTCIPADDPRAIAVEMPDASVVVASSLVSEVVRPHIRAGQEFIVLDYGSLDAAAVEMVRTMLTEVEVAA